jgi:hypothetical protein
VPAKARSEAGRRFVDSSVNRRRNPVTRGADSTVAEGHIYDLGLFAIGKNGDGEVGARELKIRGAIHNKLINRCYAAFQRRI